MKVHTPGDKLGDFSKAVLQMTESKNLGNPITHRDVKQKLSKLTWKQILRSALGASLGVKSTCNQERDFASGSPGRFILMGLILTTLFIPLLMSVVGFITE